MVNSRPFLPIRVCRKIAGPGLVSRTPAAMTRKTGAISSSTTAATVRSATALISRRMPANSGSSTCSRGSPVTGRMCSRGPATSISPGATTRSVAVPSSSQASRRNRVGSSSAEEVTATVSAPLSRTAAATSSRPPSSGTPRPTSSGSVAGREAGADHPHPAVRFLTQPRQQVDHRVLAADGQDVVNAPIDLAQRVQPAAGGPPSQQAQPQSHRQREDDVAAGDLRLGRVRGEADHRGQCQECVTDSLELLRPEADHPVVVRTGQRGRGDPGERQHEAEGEVADGPVAEADQVRGDGGDGRGGRVQHHEDREIAVHPAAPRADRRLNAILEAAARPESCSDTLMHGPPPRTPTAVGRPHPLT